MPDRDGSAGAAAVQFAASVGWIADPEQELMIDMILSHRAGKWAAFETAVIEPRQNGKTDAGQAATLYDLFVRQVDRIVWSAHKYKTCADSFTWFAGVCENYDHLRKRVHQIHYGTGEQRIQLLPRNTGPVLDFVARSTGNGRGLSGDITVLDEALYLNPSMMGALVPIMSAKPNPQIRYFSSAGVLASEVLRGLRDRGRPGGDPSLAYLEYGCPRPGEPGAPSCADPECQHLNGAVGCLLDDMAYIRGANPAKRITDDYLRKERRAFGSAPALTIEGMRERLGWWEDPPTADGADDVLTGWDDAKSGRAPSGGLALGVDVSADSRSAAIVACGGRAIEVVDYRKGAGTAWVPGRVAELRERHKVTAVGLIGGRSPALPLAKDIPGCTVLTDGEAAQASVAFARDVNEGRLSHRGQAALDIAVTSAARQLSGDGWRWSRRLSRADISPLLAAVVAAHLDGLPVEVVDRSTEALLTSFG